MADRPTHLLERALLFSFIIHGVAMVSMALFLLPGMPGGGTTDDLQRIQYIASHPWIWRAGWFPWQLTALSDLLIAVGLLRAAWIPKVPAVLTTLVTVAAIVPDQAGQIAWVTRGIALAQAGDAAEYLAYEARIFSWTAAWGATLYTLGAVGWTWCFVRGGAWNRWLTGISAVAWPLFFYVSIGPFLPSAISPSAMFVAASNAVGFVLLEIWLALVLEEVLRRSHPNAPHGRWALWRHPRRTVGAILDVLANSRFVRSTAALLPVPAFVSDISDVIYVNYLVDAERLEHLVPPGLELQRIGPEGRFGLFTFLTFRHGHFGPRLLGPLRLTMPSPIQTNWRIHVRDPRTGRAGIYFVTNAIGNTVNAIGARIMSEGMPMHVIQHAELRHEEERLVLKLDPGEGSAPDVDAELKPCATPTAGPWAKAFGTWRQMLAYVVPQDRALSTQPWEGHVTRQEIELGIPMEACEPLEGQVISRAAAAIVGDAVPFSFRVAAVNFRFESEEHDPLELAVARLHG